MAMLTSWKKPHSYNQSLAPRRASRGVAAVGSFHYPIQPPTIIPHGGNVESGVEVTIRPPASHPDSCIFYTIDGSTPTPLSQPYHGPLYLKPRPPEPPPPEQVCVRAIAVLDPMNKSGPATEVFTIHEPLVRCAPPRWNVEDGAGITTTTPVGIIEKPPYTTVLFTVHGENPTDPEAFLYTSPFRLYVSSGTEHFTLVAVAVERGKLPSEFSTVRVAVHRPSPEPSPTRPPTPRAEPQTVQVEPEPGVKNETQTELVPPPEVVLSYCSYPPGVLVQARSSYPVIYRVYQTGCTPPHFDSFPGERIIYLRDVSQEIQFLAVGPGSMHSEHITVFLPPLRAFVDHAPLSPPPRRSISPPASPPKVEVKTQTNLHLDSLMEEIGKLVAKLVQLVSQLELEWKRKGYVKDDPLEELLVLMTKLGSLGPYAINLSGEKAVYPDSKVTIPADETVSQSHFKKAIEELMRLLKSVGNYSSPLVRVANDINSTVKALAVLHALLKKCKPPKEEAPKPRPQPAVAPASPPPPPAPAPAEPKVIRELVEKELVVPEWIEGARRLINIPAGRRLPDDDLMKLVTAVEEKCRNPAAADELKPHAAAFASLLSAVRGNMDDSATERDRLREELEALKRKLKARDERLRELETDNADLTARVEELRERVKDREQDHDRGDTTSHMTFAL